MMAEDVWLPAMCIAGAAFVLVCGALAVLWAAFERRWR